MQPPDYDLNKIKFATDGLTFGKAVALYESGKVTQFEEGIRSYNAVVLGTKPYRVSIEARRYDYGHCTCYLGQNDTLCKHMVALALFVVMDGKPLTDEDKKLVHTPTCSGDLRKLEKDKIIRKYRPSAWLGTMSMGFVWFFVMLKIEKLDPAVKNTLFTYLLNIPQMTYYYNTIGTYDICFEIRLMQTSSDLTNLLREIRNILKNSLKGHELSIILREDKYTYFPDCVMNIQN